MADIFRNPKLIEENISDIDLLDFSEQKQRLSSKISSFGEGAYLIGLIADYGRGKSTLLHHIKKYRIEDLKREESWFDFNAWSIPERKELWEGFVIETARQMGPDVLDQILKEIDGKQHDGTKALIDVVSNTQILGTSLAFMSPLKHFLDASPIRRVFELQELMIKLIEKSATQTLIFILEDVDRSGEYGIYFIETLKQFFKSLKTQKKLVFLFPIAQMSFFDTHKHESYFKCLDHIEFLDNHNPNLKAFFSQILNEENPAKIQHVSSFFHQLEIHYPGTTLRKIKLILRQSLSDYYALEEGGFKPDWRICLIFAAMRYFEVDKTKSRETYFEQTARTKELQNRTDNIFIAWLYAIWQESKHNQIPNNIVKEKDGIIDLIVPNDNFVLFKRLDNTSKNIQQYPSTPWYVDSFSSHDDKARFYVCDFYLYA